MVMKTENEAPSSMESEDTSSYAIFKWFVSPDTIFATIFFLANIILLFIVGAVILDSIFSFCTYSLGEMRTGSASCPFGLHWYEVAVAYLYSFFTWIYLSLFFAFIPELLFVLLYSFALRKLTIKIKSYSENITPHGVEGRVMRGLRMSLFLFPLILIVSVSLIHWRVSDFAKDARIAAITTTKANILATVKRNPDFCKDAPTEIYLTQSPTTGNPVLHYPVGYWNGLGAAALSIENYWDGSEDPGMKFHIESYGKAGRGIVNFTESTEFNFTRYGKVQAGETYDLRIYTLNGTAQSLHTENDTLADRFHFYKGVFTEVSAINGKRTFNVYSTPDVTREECITVLVR